MVSDLVDLDAAAVVRRSEDNALALREQEVDDLRLVLAWADLHSEEPTVRSRGGDRLIQLGGDGTPLVQELCWGELAIARLTSLGATKRAAADALDLRHRLPQLWKLVQDRRLPVWVARKVATMSRSLSPKSVELVDVAVSAAVDQSPGRILKITEAKVIEADPDAHRARLAEDATKLGVHVHEVADILHDQLTSQERETTTRGELESRAVELLSHPHAAAALLDGHERDDLPEPKKRPAVIYAHISDLVLSGVLAGVVRAEGIGPVLLDQLAELLRHRDITLQPVIDLNDAHSVNAYEHPTLVKTRTLLRTLGDVFPHSANTGYRRLDHDHAQPYRPPDSGGPPGQTGDHNDAPVTRTHHRIKTHQPGYQLSQLGLGIYRWTTPHGLRRLVTPDGTRRCVPVETDDGTILELTYPDDA